MMLLNHQNKFACLVILDGWGIAPAGPANALSLAKTPNIIRLSASYPHTTLKADGEAVGLPRGDAGNTETGHLNLGAGRVVYQDLERINFSIADGSFFENKAFLGAINHAKQNNSKLHIMGLIGSGGVHSNIEHLFALLQLVKKNNLANVYLHLFTDGRDSPPTSSMTYLDQIKQIIIKEGIGTIGSIMGRYWAMDRDLHWDRTAKAYFALTKAQAHLVKTAQEAIQLSYSIGKTDEFIEPAVITDNRGSPLATIQDNDSVIFFNFRIDRPRQLAAAFMIKDFNDHGPSFDFDPFLEKYKKTHLPEKVLVSTKVFDRGEQLKNLFFVTMTAYSKTLIEAGVQVAVGPENVDMPLGRVIADQGLRQIRIAESEKERFITYYFNGYKEPPFPGEDRIIIPSPDVSTYDQKPEMSAYQITETLLVKIRPENNYSLAVVNFANADMVAHTGNIAPAQKACEVVDECLGKISNYISAYGGYLFITADHGNIEEMINSHTGEIDTEHSTNPVPFIAVTKELLGKSQTLPSGILADIAPTVLASLGIEIPSSMTGRNLLEGINFSSRI